MTPLSLFHTCESGRQPTSCVVFKPADVKLCLQEFGNCDLNYVSTPSPHEMLINLCGGWPTLGQGCRPFAALQWSYVEVLEDSEIMRPWSVCVLLLVPWWMVTGCIYNPKRCWHCRILHLLEKNQNLATLEQMSMRWPPLWCGGAAVWVNEGHDRLLWRDGLSSRLKVRLSKG